MKPSKKVIFSFIAITSGLILAATFQNCSPSQFNTITSNKSLKNLSMGATGLSSINTLSADACSGTGCKKPEAYVWNFKNCIYPVGCVGFLAGNGKDVSYSHIPEPSETCNASSVRRVITLRVIADGGTKDYLFGCRSTYMSNDEFLNIMNQNSMATYTIDQRTNKTSVAASTTTTSVPIAAAVAPTSTPTSSPAATTSGSSGGGSHAGVQGSGGPTVVTYDWYFPAEHANNAASRSDWKIPAACTASNVGAVVTIKDPAMADRRFMCLASNDRTALSRVYSITPTHRYEYINGALVAVSSTSSSGSSTSPCASNYGSACTIKGQDAAAIGEFQYSNVWCNHRSAPYYQTGISSKVAINAADATNPTSKWIVICNHEKPGTYNCSGQCIVNNCNGQCITN